MIRFGILLSAAIAVLSASAGAGPSEAMAFAIGQCSAEPDARARLACYDGLAAQLKTGIPLPAAGAAMPAAPPPVAQVQPPVTQAPVSPPAQVASVPQAPAPQGQSGTWYNPTSWFGKDSLQEASNNPADFGAENVRKPELAQQPSNEPKVLQEIQSDVVSFSYALNGRFIVTLANGQVWRQLDGDTSTAHFSKSRHYVATVSRGIFGSYNFALNDGSVIYKVKRVK